MCALFAICPPPRRRRRRRSSARQASSRGGGARGGRQPGGREGKQGAGREQATGTGRSSSSNASMGGHWTARERTVVTVVLTGSAGLSAMRIAAWPSPPAPTPPARWSREKAPLSSRSHATACIERLDWQAIERMLTLCTGICYTSKPGHALHRLSQGASLALGAPSLTGCCRHRVWRFFRTGRTADGMTGVCRPLRLRLRGAIAASIMTTMVAVRPQ